MHGSCLTTVDVSTTQWHRDPGTELEEEFVDNLFDVVCAALVVDANKAQFVSSEGVELMLLMLKNKRYARGGALKTLDFACTRCVCDGVGNVL